MSERNVTYLSVYCVCEQQTCDYITHTPLFPRVPPAWPSMEEAERRQLSRELCHLLQSDLLACDLLLSLLWAGAGSLRHDSLLRPFPSPHPLPLTAEGHRDITQLVCIYMYMLSTFLTACVTELHVHVSPPASSASVLAISGPSSRISGQYFLHLSPLPSPLTSPSPLLASPALGLLP